MKSFLILLLFWLNLSGFVCANDHKIIPVTKDIQLIEIATGLYIHQSFTHTETGSFSSNGLLVIKNGKALMIDTPMTIEETKIIDQFVNDSLQATIQLFIGGHYHNDCIGGIDYLKTIGAHTILGALTKEKCVEFNLPLPHQTFEKELHFTFEEIPVECFYPGAGHSIDNIVVYFPDQGILYGGCLVKSTDSRGMGNLADAVPLVWGNTIQNVMTAYPEVKCVIPGHGNHGGLELLSHTLELTQQYFKP